MKKPVTKKNPAAVALGKMGVKTRMKWSKAKRVAQARKAIASRRDRQKKGPWFGVILFPADYQWRGVEHLAKTVDEVYSDVSARVVFWSRSRDEARARARQENLAGKWAEVVEQDWDPKSFTLVAEFVPNPERQMRAVKKLVGVQA